MTKIEDLLRPCGYPFKPYRFLRPPPPPYVVYTEDRDTRGADGRNMIAERYIELELYCDVLDTVDKAESSIERQLDAKGIPYDKSRVWIESEELMETIYEFTLVEKI